MANIAELPLGIYEKAISNHLSWEQKMLLAKESGFDCIELSIDGTPERLGRLYDDAFAPEVKAAMKNTGVPFLTFALTANRAYPLGSEDSAVREKALDIAKRGLALANELGIKVMHITGYDEIGSKCNEHTVELFKESIRAITELAEQGETVVAIETMDTEFMGSCRNIAALCREMNSKKFGIYADVGNLTALGYDMPDEILSCGEYIVGVHVKDTVPNVVRDILFGEGNVDFDAAFKALKGINYSGALIAEMWSYDKEEFHPNLKKASDFIRAKTANY